MHVTVGYCLCSVAPGKGLGGGLTQRRLTVYSEGPAAECDALHGGLRMVMPSIWSH